MQHHSLAVGASTAGPTDAERSAAPSGAAPAQPSPGSPGQQSAVEAHDCPTPRQLPPLGLAPPLGMPPGEPLAEGLPLLAMALPATVAPAPPAEGNLGATLGRPCLSTDDSLASAPGSAPPALMPGGSGQSERSPWSTQPERPSAAYPGRDGRQGGWPGWVPRSQVAGRSSTQRVV